VLLQPVVKTVICFLKKLSYVHAFWLFFEQDFCGSPLLVEILIYVDL
jgi:hypothetical protein